MHTLKIILACWAALCVTFIMFRAWAGGCFETGLEERVIPFTKAHGLQD